MKKNIQNKITILLNKERKHTKKTSTTHKTLQDRVATTPRPKFDLKPATPDAHRGVFSFAGCLRFFARCDFGFDLFVLLPYVGQTVTVKAEMVKV